MARSIGSELGDSPAVSRARVTSADSPTSLPQVPLGRWLLSRKLTPILIDCSTSSRVTPGAAAAAGSAARARGVGGLPTDPTTARHAIRHRPPPLPARL